MMSGSGEVLVFFRRLELQWKSRGWGAHAINLPHFTLESTLPKKEGGVTHSPLQKPVKIRLLQ